MDLILQILPWAYMLLLALMSVLVVFDTDDPPKALAYLLLIFLLPVLGVLFYLFFGINLRKRDRFRWKSRHDDAIRAEANRRFAYDSVQKLLPNTAAWDQYKTLVRLLANDGSNPLFIGNQVELLINGEAKFPRMLEAIAGAKQHIHLEYYIIENDVLGNQIKDLLIAKAKAGVQVRLIYDDFGSKSIRGTFVKELRAAGAEVYPFNPIKVRLLASKINYRNHRKIVVVDGWCGFIGGINICDKYVNTEEPGRLFWRDTHLRIEGPAVRHLQGIFLQDWAYCSGRSIELEEQFYPPYATPTGGTAVQVVAGGPDCPRSIILLSMLKAINLARHSVLITTPYFIPDTSIINALKMAALTGVEVRLLVPGISDSLTVNMATRSYFKGLLKAGVKVHLYDRGFVHAKTMVVDGSLAVVGTANMDIRSFDINFEVNANVYDETIAKALEAAFREDLTRAREVDAEAWKERSFKEVFPERLARLLSPLL